jgi:hypothetical protein
MDMVKRMPSWVEKSTLLPVFKKSFEVVGIQKATFSTKKCLLCHRPDRWPLCLECVSIVSVCEREEGPNFARADLTLEEVPSDEKGNQRCNLTMLDRTSAGNTKWS